MAVTPPPAAKARVVPWCAPLSVPAEGGAPLGFVRTIWRTVALLQIVTETNFSLPSSMWIVTVEMRQDGIPANDLPVSLSRAAIGVSIGSAQGVVPGILTGRVATVHTLSNSCLIPPRAIPAIALVPGAVVRFGIGKGSRCFVLSCTVCQSVWVNILHGMQYVPDSCLRAARAPGAFKLREVLTVISPAAAPHIFAGAGWMSATLGGAMSLEALRTV